MNPAESILRRLCAVCLAGALVPLHSCAGEKAEIAGKPGAGGSVVAPTGSNASGTGTASNEQSSSSKDDDDDSGSASGSNDDAAEEEEEEEPDEPEADPAKEIEKVLKDCGVTKEQLNDPTTPLFKKTVKSYPKVFNGNFNAIIISGTYQISIKVIIDISSTLTETRQKTDFEVTGTPTQAENKAKEQVGPNRGVMLAKGFTVDERQKLTNDNKEWEGIFCTVTPTKSAIIDKGGFNKKLIFEPALPSAVSPKAVAERYKMEIGAGRTFTTTVKVESSSDPKVPAGKSITGTVKITPIDPTLTLDNGTKTITVTTDLAFQIENDFGGPVQTAQLGMLPKTIMYFKNQDLKVIVADTGDPQMGQMVLSDEF